MTWEPGDTAFENLHFGHGGHVQRVHRGEPWFFPFYVADKIERKKSKMSTLEFALMMGAVLGGAIFVGAVLRKVFNR